MFRRPKRLRFDLVEVLLLLALVAMGVWLLERERGLRAERSLVARAQEFGQSMTTFAEVEQLARKYGPGRNSQYEEEWIIRDFFNDRRGGVFVDVGANDYRLFSNTYYLETALGWSGLAVEPQRQFEAGYIEHRPRTRFRAFFVSDESNTQAKLYVQSTNPLVTSADKTFNERYGSNTTEVTAPTITLTDLLDSEKITAVDFLSLDIELWEPKALAGFDIDRFKPALVCVEAHPEVRQQILDYFAGHGYVVVGKYLRADTENLYFIPRR